MYFLATTFLIGGIYLWVVYSFLGAIVAYLGCGLAWFANNRKMPPTGYILAPAALIILLWPGGLFNRLRKLRDPSRFTVSVSPTFDTLRAFSSWNEALAFAKNQAASSGCRTGIYDHARYRKTILGTYEHRFYFVEPSGELIKPAF